MFKGADNKEVEQQLDQMLLDCERMFDLASDAMFGRAGADAVRDEIWDLDKGVNRAERVIRRELLVRASLRHAELEQGLLLAYMSVAKDIERIGDYCKNIWDLANAGVDFGGADDAEELSEHTAELRKQLEEGRRAFTAQDEREVHRLIPEIEVSASAHDELVFALVKSVDPGSRAVPRALYYRFLKRIASHLANVLSSVVMPLDRIDYYKESKATG